MPDQTTPSPYPNVPEALDTPITSDQQPAIKQETHPTKGANDPVPQVRHAEDHDSETGDRALEER